MKNYIPILCLFCVVFIIGVAGAQAPPVPLNPPIGGGMPGGGGGGDTCLACILPINSFTHDFGPGHTNCIFCNGPECLMESVIKHYSSNGSWFHCFCGPKAVCIECGYHYPICRDHCFFATHHMICDICGFDNGWWHSNTLVCIQCHNIILVT